MTDEPDLNDPAFDVPKLAGMTPWLCEYRKDGKLYSITLYGTSAKQVEEDNCDAFDDFAVCGELVSIIPADDDVARAMIEKRKNGGTAHDQ